MNTKLIPTKLDDFVLNKSIANMLKSITHDNVINMVFCGKPNTGRKTLVYAFLNSFNNCEIQKIRTLNSTELKIGNNKVNIEYITSPYHIEINLYEYGLYDKNIISDFLVNHISYKPINNIPFKFIVINHFDYMSRSTQICLKLLLDKCSDNVRFIFIAESLARIDSSIISRLSTMRVPSQNDEEVTKYINTVSASHFKLSQTHKKLILNNYEKDLFVLNNAIVCFHYNKKLDFSQINVINNYIDDIVKLIKEKNLKSIAGIRQIVYNLLLINVTVPYILKKVNDKLINSQKLNDKVRFNIVSAVSEIESRMCSIEHDLICLEFFALKVKKLLISN